MQPSLAPGRLPSPAIEALDPALTIRRKAASSAHLVTRTERLALCQAHVVSSRKPWLSLRPLPPSTAASRLKFKYLARRPIANAVHRDAALDELLLPLAELAWLDPVPLAHLGHRPALQQRFTHSGDLLGCREVGSTRPVQGGLLSGPGGTYPGAEETPSPSEARQPGRWRYPPNHDIISGNLQEQLAMTNLHA